MSKRRTFDPQSKREAISLALYSQFLETQISEELTNTH